MASRPKKKQPPKGNFDKYVFTREAFRNRKPIYFNSPYGITNYSIFKNESDENEYIVRNGRLYSFKDEKLKQINDRKWIIHYGILYLEKQIDLKK